MTAYELTEHARDALAKRDIKREWLEHVLQHPEQVVPDPMDGDLQHYLARISGFGGRVLRVIVNTTKEPPYVVTVFFDRRRNLL